MLITPMLKRIRLIFLLVSLASLSVAQQMPSGLPVSTQSQASADCSDPLQADSPQCQSQNGQNLRTTGQFPGAQTRRPTQETEPRGMNQTYSDAESQARQLATQGRSQQLPLPPEPLTEFQKFTVSTTGQILPIFGASNFRNVPSTFAPLDLTPVPPDYILGPGDELRVRVWGQVNFQANVRVDRSGEIYIPAPQIGPIHVAGLPYSELDKHLREAIGRVYRNFDLIVDVGQIRAIQVYVAGEARRAGVYTLSSLSTLIDALFASGGPSLQGSLRDIQVRRGSETLTHFDLYSFLIRGDKSKDSRLLSGDVIFIPPVGAQAAVTGSVRNPAIYELLPNESLADLIADAGGVSATASQARVSIERIKDHNERQAMEVAYDSAGLSTPVQSGDLVRIFSIVPKYSQTVTLRGNIANPGRFAWHPGMRLSELIPDKDSLLTRDYWWRRTQLGLPAPEFQPFPRFPTLKQPSDNQPITVFDSSDRSTEPGQAGTQSSEIIGGQREPYVSAPPSADRAESQNAYAGMQQPPLNVRQQTSNSSLAAQETQKNSFRVTSVPSGNPRSEALIRAPEIDWDYADIMRLDRETLKSTVIPFDLGKLVMEHDQTQDLELQPGDVVSIFSEADIHVPIAHQTKFVKLEGEFAHAGVYTVKPGETLRQLVARAGGLTPNAYLYGAEFTRESTRIMQQARIEEYVQSLDLRIQRSNIALSSSAVASPQDLASGASAQTSAQQLVSRLRQMRASGRIVLEFNPASNAIGEIPNLALEDGDRFIIPHLPSTVNVVGAVNDQNSFLYSHNKRLGSYLTKAGGMTKDADRKRSFVIRANGEVVGYSATNTVWGNDFLNLRVYPGDTIVVPEKTFKPSTLRGVLDWTQIFSQLALGVAAINVLH